VTALHVCSVVELMIGMGRPIALKQRSGSADRESSMKPGREPSGGEITSENDDMSSDKGGERPPRRKSKGSCLKLI
jgi:hypothetical protein